MAMKSPCGELPLLLHNKTLEIIFIYIFLLTLLCILMLPEADAAAVAAAADGDDDDDRRNLIKVFLLNLFIVRYK